MANMMLRSRVRGRNGFSQETILAMVVVAVFFVFSLTLQDFLSINNLVVIAKSISALGILGVGMAIVVIGRGLDLSLVASMAVSTSVTINLMQQNHSTIVAIAAGVLLAVGFGAFNGALIAFIEIPPLFATLASGLLLFGLSRSTILPNLVVEVPAGRQGFSVLGQGRIVGIPINIIAFAIVCVAVHLILKYTVLGRWIYAIGDNSAASALTGIPVRPVTIVQYTLASVLGLFAGLVVASSTGGFGAEVATSSLIYEVLLVVVVGGVSLVGGRGGVPSVVIGTLLVGILLNGMTIMNLNNHTQNIAKGLILFAALILDNRLHPRDEETVRQGD